MRVLRIVVLVCLIVIVGIQFVPTEHNLSESVPETDFMLVNEVPDAIQAKLKVSCYDCHSNNTSYPWYSRVQPVSWFLEGHIEEGKSDLNFNEWEDYSTRKRYSKLRSIISQIEDDEMPLESYSLIHSDAKLSGKEKAEIISYMNQLKERL